MNEMIRTSDTVFATAAAATPRTLETVAAEIRTFTASMLNNIIEIGRRMCEAKDMLPHGQFGEWIKKNTSYSRSTANNFMRLYLEYGTMQGSLFGAAVEDAQTFGQLSYSQALALLALPAGEREEFVKDHDMEHMSIRELNEALRARDEAEEAAAAAQEEAEQARAEARSAQEALETQRDTAQRLQDALSKAYTAAQTAEEEHTRLVRELEDLRSRSAGTDTAAEAARQAAIDEMTEKVNKARDARKQADQKRKTAEEALEAVKKELAELKAKGPEVRELTQEERDALTAGAVGKAKAEAAELIRGLEKKLAAADPNVAEFKVHFNAWQEEYRRMAEVLARTDGERAGRLRQAVKAALEQMTGP